MDIATVAIIAIAVWLITQVVGNANGGGLPGASPALPPAPAGRMSPADIAQAAASAGFSGQDLLTAVAIALAESNVPPTSPASGNPAAVGDLSLTPGGSIGLWQINLHYHPEYSAQQLLDPQSNANAAYAIYRAAGGFSPWTTFKTGTYMAYLDQASQYLSA